MTTIDDIYSTGNFLKAADLQEGKEVTVTIAGWSVDEIEKDSKDGGKYTAKQVVLEFEGSDKRLGLNKTNSESIASFLQSRDPSKWIGGKLVLFRTKVSFGSQMVDGIRIRTGFFEETQDDAPF